MHVPFGAGIEDRDDVGVAKLTGQARFIDEHLPESGSIHRIVE